MEIAERRHDTSQITDKSRAAACAGSDWKSVGGSTSRQAPGPGSGLEERDPLIIMPSFLRPHMNSRPRAPYCTNNPDGTPPPLLGFVLTGRFSCVMLCYAVLSLMSLSTKREAPPGGRRVDPYCGLSPSLVRGNANVCGPCIAAQASSFGCFCHASLCPLPERDACLVYCASSCAAIFTLV